MVKPFEKAYPQYKGDQINFTFNSTGALVTLLEAGDPCDVIMGAKTADIDPLYPQYVDQPENFCQNKLEVILPKSNPGDIKSLAGLAAQRRRTR